VGIFVWLSPFFFVRAAVGTIFCWAYGINILVSRPACAVFRVGFAFGVSCSPFAFFRLCGGDRENALFTSRGKLLGLRTGLA
jgi:hypothetical protein